jgi:uncharacterized HAD superfamily protein
VTVPKVWLDPSYSQWLDMMARQAAFNVHFMPAAYDQLTDEQRVAITKEYVLHMMSECDEILREMNWKFHRPLGEKVIPSNLLEELIDLFKYWMSTVLVWQYDPREVVAEFHRKSAVVEQRFKQEQMLHDTDRPIAIIDIDGVLADYPASFVQYVNRQRGVRADYDGTYDNLVAGMSRIDVVRWKNRYREEGFEGEHVMPTVDAREFMGQMRALGYFLCVVTARPYATYKRMFADTLQWFTKHDIPFDAIIFHEDKQTFVLSLIDRHKQVKFAVEDHPGQARSIASLEVMTFLLDRPYNLGQEFGILPVVRATNLQTIVNAFRPPQ